MIVAILLTLAAEALPSASAARAVEEPDPKAMNQSEIRSFNAKLDRGHPYYIRCVKSADTGSLVRRNFSCRTNEQWEAAEAVGNDNARDLMDRMGPKSTNTSG